MVAKSDHWRHHAFEGVLNFRDFGGYEGVRALARGRLYRSAHHHRATNLHPRLHITYQIRFRVNDRNWQTIDQTLTTQGPPTTLTIKEATPLLTS